MTFFNKKTEVMNVELTPYGRYLLSIGKLKPSHYRFFDDGVVYDSSHAPPTPSGEHQSKVDLRIVEETPKLKINSNSTGVTTNFNNYQAVDTLLDSRRYNIKDDTLNESTKPLGTIVHESVNTPAFEVSVTDSHIITASKFYNSDSAVDLNIPQIDIYLMFLTKITNYGIFNQFDTTVEYQSNEFSDGQTYSVLPQIPIVEILEKNGIDTKENFLITVYKVNDPPDTNKIEYTKMKLEKQFNEVVDDYLVDNNEYFLEQGLGSLDEDHLHHYFKIVYDYDIQESEFCRQIGDIEVLNIYLDKQIKCPDKDFDQNFDFDQYSNQIRPEDLEDCD